MSETLTMPLREDAERDEILPRGETYESINKTAEDWNRSPAFRMGYRISVLAALGMVGVLCMTLCYVFYRGIGVWGTTIPVAWATPIVNFVWWVGIGHAGTFISAILLILHQNWRDSINRFAEAMTLVAIVCAGLMPLIHLGRPTVFYWLIPYPSTMNIWPQFRSPLVWDMFAILTYITVSFLFFMVGLLPDLATWRDRAKTKAAQKIFGVLAGGWRGSARQWAVQQKGYRILAAIATPLVVSVHSVVAFDFAVGIVPAWHSEIFPPYFVAGAVYSGFAMVIDIAILLKLFVPMGRFITEAHFRKMTAVMLSMGLIVGYAYLAEAFNSWLSGNPFEEVLQADRYFGESAKVYWTVIACNVVLPQLLWITKIRRCMPLLFALTVLVNIGMWLERYLIIISGLSRDYLTSKWTAFNFTFWDGALLFGLFGVFFLFLLLFVRFLPVLPMHEMKSLLHERKNSLKAGVGT